MYTLQEVMSQALEDSYALRSDHNGYKSVLLFGCKIMQDNKTKKIEIVDTTKTSDWYTPLTESEEKLFLENGWRIGVYKLSLSNYRTKLDRIEELIKREVNGKKNPKQINKLKSSREKVMNDYSKINKKLNQTLKWKN
jgi:hypothetical protein